MAASKKEQWDEGEVWMRSVDKDGGVTYTHHRCWNANRFVQSMHRAAAETGGSAAQITKADFDKATRKK